MKSRRTRELEWNIKWGDLSRYNEEVAHGIVHTPEYDRRMALLRAEYKKAMIEEVKADGGKNL